MIPVAAPLCMITIIVYTGVMESEWFSNIKRRILTEMLCVKFKRGYSVNGFIHQVKFFKSANKLKITV